MSLIILLMKVSRVGIKMNLLSTIGALGLLLLAEKSLSDSNILSYQPLILCNQTYSPEYCAAITKPEPSLAKFVNVEDFDNCAPGLLPLQVRNYYMSASGRAVTHKRNFDGYKRLAIVPQMLRDVSMNTVSTEILRSRIAIPLGLSPVALQVLANPIGDKGSAKAAAKAGAVFILSILSATSIEEIAMSVQGLKGPNGEDPVLWMQTFILKSRNETLHMVRRAENAGFKAIVVTVDTPILASSVCDAKDVLNNASYPNLFHGKWSKDKIDASITFRDLTWLSRQTTLPIVAKGIMTGEDAIRAVQAGAKAILVSNHGGRQLDNVEATIDALPKVVKALKSWFPSTDVYVDGGIRSGYDMYKAMARGAKAVFFGRPVVWGLAVKGEQGVSRILSIMRQEFHETMLLSGRFGVCDINNAPLIQVQPLLPQTDKLISSN